MNHIKLIFTIFFLVFAGENIIAQNVMINISTQNAGIVKKGENVFVEVFVVNANSKDFVDVYKLKATITVPKEIVSIDSVGMTLPTGWKVLSNDGISIVLSNGTDMIAAKDDRKILIPLKANKVGGYSTIAGSLTFSNGIAPGNEIGSLKNDLPGDNNSTTTCKVIK
jgi:hypothetical protein